MGRLKNKGIGPKAGRLAITALAGLFIAEPAVAENDGCLTDCGILSGDIIVTATRRDETAASVPLSLVAIGREGLDRARIATITDLSRATPGLSLRNGWGDATKISIRGISSAVGTATTGIYIDDTPIQVRSLGAADIVTNAYPEIFDLERVEVLRGPQGTLFGAGSEGGTVRFITPSPSLDDTHVYGKVSLATTESGAESWSAGASATAPLVEDKIGVSLSAFARQDGGWIDRAPYETGTTVAKDINRRNAIALRGAIAFAPTETLTITPSLFYQRWKRRDTDQFWEELSDTDDNRHISGQPIAQPARDHFFLPAIKGELDLGAARLITNTSWFDRKSRTVVDYSYHTVEGLSFIATQGAFTLHNLLPFNYEAPSNFRSKQRAFTQEARLQSTDESAPVTWTVGAFYQNSRQKTQQAIVAPLFPTFIQSFTGLLVPGGLTVPAFFGVDMLPGDISYFSQDRAKDTQLAGFGQLDWKATDRLTLTLGGRVARTKFSFANYQNGPINFGPTVSRGSGKETPFTPKFGASYKPDDTALVYASATKGFRPGGGNTSVPALCAADLGVLGFTSVPATYKSDSVWSYEVGAKKASDDDRINVQASAFLIDWKNIQQSVALFRCGFAYTANFGKAVSRGFDAQISVKPVDGLTLSGSVAYNDAHYTRSRTIPTDAGPVTLVTDGDKLPTPPWQVRLSSAYDFRLAGNASFVQVNYDYASSYQRLPTAFNTDVTIKHAEATHFVSARTGMAFGPVQAALFVDNVLNSEDALFRTRDSVASSHYRQLGFRPRTFGIELIYRN